MSHLHAGSVNINLGSYYGYNQSINNGQINSARSNYNPSNNSNNQHYQGSGGAHNVNYGYGQHILWGVTRAVGSGSGQKKRKKKPSSSSLASQILSKKSREKSPYPSMKNSSKLGLKAKYKRLRPAAVDEYNYNFEGTYLNPSGDHYSERKANQEILGFRKKSDPKVLNFTKSSKRMRKFVKRSLSRKNQHHGRGSNGSSKSMVFCSMPIFKVKEALLLKKRNLASSFMKANALKFKKGYNK